MSMSLTEALIVSVLCFSIVFLGLTLCILFVDVFSRFTRNIRWDGAHGNPVPAPVKPPPSQASAEPAVTPSPLAESMEPPTPEILAVIAAAIEIDLRLYQGSGDRRLTIRRALPR